MDKRGEMTTVRRAIIVKDARKVNRLKDKLSEEEVACMVVNECKSHVPTLVCVVNAVGALKKHFCEKELGRGDPIRHFLFWCAEDIVKKTNSFRGERNYYVFVAHNASGYDTQFMYQAAYNMFGSKNVSVLLHMNRMIELKVQIATGSRLSTMIFKDSYKFINLPLRSMPKSFGFHNELQKGFFPHDLNTKGNMDYKCLGLPDRKYFGTNEMTIETLKRFEEWYVNEDCRLRNNDIHVCFRCCTLGQTFNDNFSLTRRRKSSSTIVSRVIPLCTLSKVHLMMMCFIHKFIQSHYFVKLNVMEHEVYRYIGESVFFHDCLVDLFVKEAGDPTQHGVMDKNDIYVFDMHRMKQRGHMCTFVYVRVRG